MTEDRKLQIISGVFELNDTYGLPLDLIVNVAREQGYVPAWDHYVIDAREAGWLDHTIYAKLKEVDLDPKMIALLMIAT